MHRHTQIIAVLLLLGAPLLLAGAQTPAPTRPRPTRDEMLRSMATSKARADSAAARVSQLAVTPRELDLAVGDSVYTPDLFARLQVRGLTADGDTLRDFAKGFMLVPSPLIERKGSDIFARGAGDATLWVVLGSEMSNVNLRDTTRAIRVLIHIK